MEKNWQLNGKDYYSKDDIAFLQSKINNFFDFNFSRLLAHRLNIDISRLKNIETCDEELTTIRNFLRPSLSQLYNPFLYVDMQKAVDRLLYAVDNNQKILIYGDYDVDGTTSVALLYSFIKKNLSSNILFYIPDRYTEGYGVSYKGVDYAAQNNCKLIISIDCGIKDNEKIDYAKTLGIDFIVCDHHTVGATLPNAVAVLDAKRSDNTYPFTELSGCGVGFKFMQAVCIKLNIPFQNLLNYIDLVAVSIGSDIVPIVDENRVLAYFGLKKLNSEPIIYNNQLLELQPSTAFKAIIKESKLDNKKILMYDSVYSIGPRINACGRIDKGTQAVNMLLTEKDYEADNYAHKISNFNSERKDLDFKITQEALDILANEPNNSTNSASVVYGDTWHKGVVGIVASRLTETYYRPTIVFSKSDENLTGSARSVSDFNIYNAIEHCKQYLTAFGGHKFAAGLNLKFENYDKFKSAFLDYVDKNILPYQTFPTLNIYQIIDFSIITKEFYNQLQNFEPFGPCNDEPIFATKNVVDAGFSRTIGKNNEHLRLQLRDSSGTVLTAIAFGMSKYFNLIQLGICFDICYKVQQNVYNNSTSIQLMIVDIKF